LGEGQGVILFFWFSVPARTTLWFVVIRCRGGNRIVGGPRVCSSNSNSSIGNARGPGVYRGIGTCTGPVSGRNGVPLVCARLDCSIYTGSLLSLEFGVAIVTTPALMDLLVRVACIGVSDEERKKRENIRFASLTVLVVRTASTTTTITTTPPSASASTIFTNTFDWVKLERKMKRVKSEYISSGNHLQELHHQGWKVFHHENSTFRHERQGHLLIFDLHECFEGGHPVPQSEELVLARMIDPLKKMNEVKKSMGLKLTIQEGERVFRGHRHFDGALLIISQWMISVEWD
jgi:hypothetical protein